MNNLNISEKYICKKVEEKPMISAEDLKDKIEHSSNLTLVNTQDKEQFNNCHIKGSINAPLPHLKNLAKDWDRTRIIVIHGTDTEDTKKETAYSILLELGFTKVKIYQGGLKEWKEKGFNCFCKYEQNSLNGQTS